VGFYQQQWIDQQMDVVKRYLFVMERRKIEEEEEEEKKKKR
tara:strand:+ start:650 stop:772 length:123 start_codon:yes stop_codon:yes gene_type:complete